MRMQKVNGGNGIRQDFGLVTDEGDRNTYIYGVEDKPKIVSESQWSRFYTNA